MMAQTKQRLAVGLVLSLVLCTLPAHAEILGGNENSKPKNATSVIVIGAGLAGVAAARDLVDAGVSNVVLLEARPRAGGRLHSVNTTAGNTHAHSPCLSGICGLLSVARLQAVGWQ